MSEGYESIIRKHAKELLKGKKDFDDVCIKELTGDFDCPFENGKEDLTDAERCFMYCGVIKQSDDILEKMVDFPSYFRDYVNVEEL